MFYLVDKTEDLSQGPNISDNLRDCSEEARAGGRGKPGCIGVFATKTKFQNIKRLLLIKENRHLKLRNLVLVCVWEDARVWAY